MDDSSDRLAFEMIIEAIKEHSRTNTETNVHALADAVRQELPSLSLKHLIELIEITVFALGAEKTLTKSITLH